MRSFAFIELRRVFDDDDASSDAPLVVSAFEAIDIPTSTEAEWRQFGGRIWRDADHELIVRLNVGSVPLDVERHVVQEVLAE
ncbi:hypothetical protein GCM10011490_23060 [Pseudoclavibacter endophyticus]|nr:hypothetical protein [Pseudoclavibacter endophyticus]GGA71719.1 hypothetical protein GCM10011490_23060 [Pseudoclavibacter endophyticus]